MSRVSPSVLFLLMRQLAAHIYVASPIATYATSLQGYNARWFSWEEEPRRHPCANGNMTWTGAKVPHDVNRNEEEARSTRSSKFKTLACYRSPSPSGSLKESLSRTGGLTDVRRGKKVHEIQGFGSATFMVVIHGSAYHV